jgi:hypothetical protein
VFPQFIVSTPRAYILPVKMKKTKPFTCFVSNPTIKIKYREKR